ncbi:Gfo/Idh/MocA family protein [Martelella radicis]|uniref:Putative dehydrogenase n=1 Tax=Martelella radicis TaxID=1397476 RepID=A0A7W6KME0_9HYPH|nr:Gfo/Idh/MocA family oxidoreductase [Martelella radicis]MBB4123765.1 putative dehydrogenase [Martelella radicis]
MSDRLKWGVLSTAGIGMRKVIPGMKKSELGIVHAIASRDEAKASAAAEKLQIPVSYGSYEALLADPEIDAIYNPLPVNMHVDWSIKAMESGKHVLCEKPIAMSAEEAKRLIDARERTGKQVLEAVMVRQHPQWLRVAEIIRSGEIGEVCLMQTTMSFFNDDPNNIRNIPEVGGGALYDVGCYALFLSRFVFNAEPEQVVAMSDIDPNMKTDRLMSGIVDFGGGKQLSFACGTQLARFQTVQIFGRKGRIEVPISLNAPQGGEVTITIDADGTNEPDKMRREVIPASDQYTLQADLAARVFLGETAAEYPIENAVNNMAAIDALYRSSKSHTWEKVASI